MTNAERLPSESDDAYHQRLDRLAAWKIGFPPGEYYQGMTDDYEVCFTPGGLVWHRRVAAIRCCEEVNDA